MNISIAMGIAGALVAAAIVIAIAYFFLRRKVEAERSGIRNEAEKALADARRQAEQRIREADIEAKEKVLAARAEFDKTVQARRQEIAALEKRVQQKEENLDRKLTQQEKREEEYARKEKAVADEQKKLEEMEAEVQRVIDDQRKRLEQISGLTAVDAKRDLIKSVENGARLESAGLIRRVEEEANEQATHTARRTIGKESTRPTQDTGDEGAGSVDGVTVSVVALPSDDLKGRIIGREGRNIRALEAATGVDLIIDDTPEAIVISAFEPLRREVARHALEKLIVDGRIHPARIEEIVEKVRSELWEKIRQEGEATALEFGIPDLHPELVKMLGRLKYRTSYGQNVLQHSKEVGWLAMNMAAELGANVDVVRRAGLLHDIGKAIDREMEGTHLELGREVLKKFGETNEVIHAMEC